VEGGRVTKRHLNKEELHQGENDGLPKLPIDARLWGDLARVPAPLTGPVV